MKHLILSLILLLSCHTISATLIDWNGGTGEWEDAANWTPNKVPEAGDVVRILDYNNSEVIISNGFQAEANRVIVGNQATLIVDGHLLLIESVESPLVNRGHIYVSGNVEFIDPKESAIFAYQGQGNSHLEIATNAEVNISSIQNGVSLTSDANVIIRGSMYLIEIPNFAFSLASRSQVFIEDRGLLYFEDVRNGLSFYSQATLINDGEILFTGNVVSAAININSGELVNNLTGSITILDGPKAIENRGLIQNYGDIEINSAGLFDNIDGTMINGKEASLRMSNCERLLISESGGLLQNFGLIDIENAKNTAITVDLDGVVENYNGGEIYIEGANTSQGFQIKTWGRVYNEGFVRINVPNNEAIHLLSPVSVYHNRPCSITSILGGYMFIPAAATFTNNSWLFLKDPNASHILSTTTFVNNGVIADRFATLSGLNYTNNGFVTNPLQGPLANGQAIANAFTVGGTGNVSNPSIRISHNGPSAGSYSLSTNTYTPNAAAVGDNDLRLRITLKDCGTKWFRIPVDNPTPFVGQINTDLNFIANKQEGQIFPNPAVEEIQVIHGLAQDEDIQLELRTLDGRLISQQKYTAVPGEPLRFSRPSGLPNGNYILRLVGSDETSISHQLIWQ